MFWLTLLAIEACILCYLASKVDWKNGTGPCVEGSRLTFAIFVIYIVDICVAGYRIGAR